MPKYGLIGQRIGHSQSKIIHSKLGNYEYDYLDISDSDRLAETLANTEYSGFNVTNPYKVEIIKYLDEISDTAKRIGAVNTIKRMSDGRLKGFNTDLVGFMYMLTGKVFDKKCVILGSGGAARSVAVALENLGASEIVIVSRTPSSVDKDLKDRYTIGAYNRMYFHYDAAILVNTTPVGTYPEFDHSPITDNRLSVRMFTELELAVDLIYNPYRTKFLQDARRLTKCNTKSGIDMLIVQAIASSNIWNSESESLCEYFYSYENLGEDFDDTIAEIKRDILEKQLNIIAIGMPGSGKTTILRRYAYELCKEFIDTDAETEKLLGDSISNIIEQGESGIELFRKTEHLAVKEACKSNGAVIATGGGTILNPISRDILRSNGIIVYLRRPLELLSVKERPISISQGVSELFIERDRIYRRVSDTSILNSRIFGSGKSNTYNYELKGFVYYMARKLTKYLNELANNKWT